MHPSEAAHSLAAYNAAENGVLREHQTTVFDAAEKHFSSGHTGGVIALPPGAGKSVIISELVEAFPTARKILNLSPTQDILRQTWGRAEQLRGRASMTNYYADEKDASGQAVNTTFTSAENMIKRGEINPEEVDLIIVDELHTVGESRAKVLDLFPNAVFIGLTATPDFTTILELQKAGKITGHEPWYEMFTKTIHEMSLEEGMELGILIPADIHLLKTHTRVGNVAVKANGEYSATRLQRYINTRTRNALTLAMIGGRENLPFGLTLGGEIAADVDEMHEKIAGKRTMVFCPSINDAEKKAETLRSMGVSALAIHGQISSEERSQAYALHRAGEIQVLCGVEVMRVGVDCPETEVGIFADPTQSHTTALQEFGRILRVSPDTEKERAIAIQLVDTFTRASQRPVLLPELFEENVFSSKTRKIYPRATGRTHGIRSDTPIVEVFGELSASQVMRTTSERVMRERLSRVEQFGDLETFMADMIGEITAGKAPMTYLQFAQRLANTVPYHIPQSIHSMLIESVASPDKKLSERARVITVLLEIKSVLNAAEQFISDEKSAAEREAIVSHVIDDLTERVVKIKPDSALPVSQEVHRHTQTAVIQYISNRENVPAEWVRKRKLPGIESMITSYFAQETVSVDLVQTATNIAQRFEVNVKEVEAYMRSRLHEPDAEVDWSLADVTDDSELQARVAGLIQFLDEREREVIRLRFFKDHTYEEVGKEFGLTRERMRQIEAKAMAKLRARMFYRHL